MKVLNWSMLKNPLNYLIVLLMLVIAGVGGHLLLTLLGWEPKTSTASAGSESPNTVKSFSTVTGS